MSFHVILHLTNSLTHFFTPRWAMAKSAMEWSRTTTSQAKSIRNLAIPEKGRNFFRSTSQHTPRIQTEPFLTLIHILPRFFEVIIVNLDHHPSSRVVLKKTNYRVRTSWWWRAESTELDNRFHFIDLPGPHGDRKVHRNLSIWGLRRQ